MGSTSPSSTRRPRIANGKLQLELGPVDLSALVGEAIETVRPSADAKQVEVQLERPAGPTWLVGDATRLKQVVGNLLTNAVEFTDQGGSIWVRVDR